MGTARRIMLKENLALIVPSRGRPHNIQEILNLDELNDGNVDLFVGIDDDDPEKEQYKKLDGIYQWVEGPRLRMVGTLNAIANDIAKDYYAVGFIGDDHRPRTKGWDSQVLESLHNMGTGFTHGDDGHWGDQLATYIFMTSDIIRTLGYMAPPTFTHLYIDNVWSDLSRAVDRFSYLPNLLIEHVHPAFQQTEWDSLYKEVNADSMYAKDRQAYEKYKESQFFDDINKLRQIL